MGSFGNQGAGFYAGTNWGNPYGGRYYSPSGQLTGSTGVKASSPLDVLQTLPSALILAAATSLATHRLPRLDLLAAALALADWLVLWLER